MKVPVARLREVLDLLKPVVPRNPTLKSLVNILLKDGQAVATDLETMIIVEMPEANGSFLLPYRDVVKFLQYTNGGETLNIGTKKSKIQLTWSDGNASFPAHDPKDFPEVPVFTPAAETDIDSDTLIPALSSLLAYVATETSRPVLTGVTISLGENILVAAGDGSRMAFKELPLSFPQEGVRIIPAQSVGILEHLWRKTPRTPPESSDLIPVITAKKQIKFGIDNEQHMSFVFGKAATALIKPIQGNPPDWLKVIPKGKPVLTARVFAPELELAVRRIMQVALEGSKIARIVFNDGKVKVSAKANDQEIESSIDSLGAEGEQNRFGVNAPYLLDYLQRKEGIVTISMTAETEPVTFQHKQDPKVLIMPMKVDW